MKFLSIVILCFLYLNSHSQDVSRFSQLHFSGQKRGMTLLGTWGLGNTLMGALGTRSENLEVKSFHQMNMGWGLINAGIAGIGYYASQRKARDPLTPIALLKENQKAQSVLLFNAGLDLGYMATGL